MTEPGFVPGNSGSREHPWRHWPRTRETHPSRPCQTWGANLAKPSEESWASFLVSLLRTPTSSRPMPTCVGRGAWGGGLAPAAGALGIAGVRHSMRPISGWLAQALSPCPLTPGSQARGFLSPPVSCCPRETRREFGYPRGGGCR